LPYQDALDTLNHAVNIFSSVKEAQLFGESNLSHDVKGVELDPFAQVYRLVLICEPVQLIKQKQAASIHGWFICQKRRQTECIGNRFLHFAVVSFISGTEKVQLGLSLPGNGLDGIKRRLGIFVQHLLARG